MRLQYSLFVLILTCCQLGISQSVDSSFNKDFRPPMLTFKVSPLPLLDYTPAIQAGVEIRTIKNESFNLDYGYITDIHRDRNFTGFKLRGEYRWYKAIPNAPNTMKFRGLQYMYKQVIATTTAPVWRNNRSYQEILTYRVISRTNSIYAIGGFSFDIHSHLGVETSLGLGYRRLDILLKDVPEDGTVTSTNSNFLFQSNRPGDFHSPAFFLSFRIMWRLW